MMAHALLLLAVCSAGAALFTPSAQAAGTVVLVYSMQRHGARDVLAKTPLLTESDSYGGANLIPEGQRQAYNAGVVFQQRYLNTTACSVSGTCLLSGNVGSGLLYGPIGTSAVAWSAYNTLVRSSDLDRTLLSATSYLQGIFLPLNNATSTRYLPTALQLIPIYSTLDKEDYTIRAYTKCPTYDNTLTAWYASAEFATLKNQSATLRNYIAQVQPGIDTTLQNWWNVYDAFNVWRTYGLPVGANLAPLNASIYTNVTNLANYMETAKMRSGFTKNLIGGTVLADILVRMQNATDALAQGQAVYYKLLSLSGHYNTLLGVLGALAVDQSSSASQIAWLTVIPKAAAVMVFELLQDPANTTSYAVRLMYQPNGPTTPYLVLPLPCAVAGGPAESIGGVGSCTLSAFRTTAGAVALTSVESWCTACANTQGLASIALPACQAHNLTATLASTVAAAQAAASATSCGDNGLKWKIATSVVVTFVGTLLFAGLIWMLVGHSVHAAADTAAVDVVVAAK